MVVSSYVAEGRFLGEMEITMKVRAVEWIIILSILASTMVGTVYADVFVRTNKDGQKEFSNAPAGPGWVLYASEEKETTKLKFIGETKTKSLDEIISEAALIHGVDADLVKAIVRAESNSNPLAISKKGAKGLMQLMPATARKLSVHAPFDPRQNIVGGVKHIKGLLTKYGDLKLALAAYNAGPKAVKKYSGVPPYEETKKYIKKVLKFYKLFKEKKGFKVAER
jgi:soluble lytic murein transglycosylase-like protein